MSWGKGRNGIVLKVNIMTTKSYHFKLLATCFVLWGGCCKNPLPYKLNILLMEQILLDLLESSGSDLLCST